MRDNKHAEFVKSIRLLSGEEIKENGKAQVNKIAKQEESDLQKELERRFDELFGTTEEN